MWCGMHGTVTFKKFVTEFIVLENKEHKTTLQFFIKSVKTWTLSKF